MNDISSYKLIKHFITRKLDIRKIQGSKTPLSLQNQIIEVKQVFLLKEMIEGVQICFFVTNSAIYFGCILARQSSDFLVTLAQLLYKQRRKNDSESSYQNTLHTIQYRFPKDLHSLKLILLQKIESELEIADKMEQFCQFCHEFKEKQKAIINQVF